MKQEVVPTSPKSAHRKQAEERRNGQTRPYSRVLFFAIVVSLIFGAVAGIFGFLIAANVPSDWPIIGRFNVIEVFEKERQQTLLGVRGNEQSLIESSPSVISEVVTVYAAAPTIDAPSTLLGDAVVATADGWLIMATDAIPADAKPVAVLSDGSAVEITQRIDDTLSKVSYLKVNARNLDSANFAGDTVITVGQALSVVEKHIGSYVVYERRAAGEVLRVNTLRSTARMDQFTVLDPLDAASRVSSPVFSNNGDFLGITIQSGVMVPAAVLHGALQTVIAQGAVQRSIANMDYINAARLTTDQRAQRTLPPQGIHITEVRAQEGVDAGEASKLLQAGDTITAINNVVVTEFTDWSTVIHSKPKGTVFYLQVTREGKAQTITWTS